VTDEPEAADEVEVEPAAEKPKKKTRRGTRGGRGRKRKAPVVQGSDEAQAAAETAEPDAAPAQPLSLDEQWDQMVGALHAGPEDDGARTPRIHTPEPELERADEPAPETVEVSADGDQPEKPRKKTRRGTRGGRSRRKRKVAPKADAPAEAEAAGE
jgi:ribonuclease E